MSTPESTPKKHDDYKVAIVCAIGFEMKAARAMLDHKHPRLPSARGDPNLYVLGEIGGHNVVLACLSGSQGKGAAAIVATNMSRTFPSIEWRFLVGIGGGVPSAKHDIRLGDVVVSMPEGEYGGVVQYDLGKDTDDGFKLKGFLWPPPTILRNAVELMRIELSEEEMAEVLRDRCRLSKYERPASKHDVLFEEDYSHVAGGEECKNCDKTRVKTRPPRSFEGPEVHYGLIASGDRVMKSVRKAVAATGSIGDILCFEMEAAGIATEFPCLVIRGVSDYADSHKNDRWQLYAAAAAAAYTRELLSSYVPPEQPDDDETMGQSAQSPPLGRREPISQNMSGSGVQNAGTFSVGGDFNIGVSPEQAQEAISEKCLAALCETNPRDDRERIIQTKGGLLAVSCGWVFENETFKAWRDDPRARLLWVKGDPGKGKTMLLCGIIRELEQSTINRGPLSYFLCQGTDSHINSATAVVRGLIYLLLKQHTSLVSHVREYYDPDGKPLFREANAWIALSQLLSNMLNAPALENSRLVIDALDECETGLPLLLRFISEHSSESHRVKWIVSSRNRLDIEEQLADSGVKLSLELKANATQVSNAVDAYIDARVSELKTLPEKHKAHVRDTLRRKADGTFLWAALVIKELQRAKRWTIRRVVEEVPMDLGRLYDRMITQIQQQSGDEPAYCRLTLSAVTLAFRPPSLAELAVLSGLPDVTAEDTDNMRDIVSLCGSFLTIQDGHVYLVHQSVKDYLEGKDGASENHTIFPLSPALVHHAIFSRSLQAMRPVLRRDIYNLEYPGVRIEDTRTPSPDPLAAVRYSCVHWIDHFCHAYSSPERPRECIMDLSDEGPVLELFNQHFLYWLESLSLLGKMSDGMFSLTKLLNVVQSEPYSSPSLVSLLKDAERFALNHVSVMEKAPLQTYASALVFTPIESQVRRTYWEKERLPFIKSVAGIEDSWGAHRQTLEYTGIINTMALSHDGKILASASARAIHIWHISTGTLWMTLDNPDVDRYACSSVAFSPDTKTVISNSRSATIRVWDIETGKCSLLHELGPDYRHTIGALSPDGSTALLSSSSGSEDYVCDTATGSFRACPYSCWTTALAFSPDSKMVASASRNGKIYLWDSATCVVHQTLEGGSFMVESLAFSPKTKMLAAAGYSGEVRLWDTETGVLQRELRPRDFVSRFFALSPDGTMFASRSLSNSSDISLWDTTGVLRQTLKGHTGYVTKIVFSLDSKMLVSASRDGIIHTWDVTSALDDHTAYLGNSTTSAREMPLVHSAEVTTVALSPDGKTAATASADHTICLWDIIKGSPPQALQANLTMRDPGATFFYMANGITFSPDGKTLAVCGEDTIFFWDVARGTLEQEVGISRPLLGFRYLTFSPDGKTIATEVWSSAIYLSSTETGTLGRTLEHDERQIARALGFSQDGATFASCAGDVFLWDVATGELQRALEHTSVAMRARFSPDGRTLVSLSNDDMVRIWNLSTGSMSRKILQATGGWVPCAETFSTDGMCVFVETDGGLSRVKLSGRRSKNFQEPKPFPRMFVTGRWVRAGGVDLLWLPPSYKRGINAAGHGVVVLGRQDGTVTILRFDTSTLEPRVLDA